MPLNRDFQPECMAFFELPVKTAVTAFLWGVVFVIAPFPQMVIDRSSDLTMIATAFAGPLCGIAAMIFVLLKSEQKNALTLFRINAGDCLWIFSGTAAIIATYAVVNVLWKILLLSLAVPFEENQFLMTVASRCSRVEFVLLGILVTFIVPVAEELLFRRILFAGLLSFGSRTAFFVTSAVFAAAHLFLAGTPGLFVIGAGLQFLYIRRKNLAVAIFCHGLLNACAVLSILAVRKGV